MSKRTLIPATTSAVANVELDTGLLKTGTISITASNLATTEEVDLEIYAGNDTFIPWANNSGTAYKLTATVEHLSLPNPGTVIRVSKDLTASPCAVIASWAENTKRGY